ncbi:MAG: cytochrome c biogenesis protein ResB [Nitrospirae bacterium]|nr:cytochrome c biogenesis protein ResB [Nitrospirota bacterium]
MSEFNNIADLDNSKFPIEPGNPIVAIWRKIHAFLTSAKLAMFLLVTILTCCVIGVTIFRDKRAWDMIFSTLWFNGLLVLLVVNVAFCFFSRIWGRKLTLVSLGMILFHLSFVAILGGIIYNSLFYFRGLIRLTEGETLPNGELQSYDSSDRGRFFNLSKLKGETTLIKMHTMYKVDGDDKRAAYEIAVGEGSLKKQGIIYITKNLDYRGFRYYNDKEGYSLLIMLYDKLGRELYGAYVPLQSLKQKDDTYLYTTGTKDGPGDFPFPQDSSKPLFTLQAAYVPTPIKELSGDAFFKVWPLVDARHEEKAIAEGKAAIGEMFDAGDYYLSVREVRYWVGMNVRYDPGLPIVLASLWVGLSGVVITFIGRILKRKK